MALQVKQHYVTVDDGAQICVFESGTPGGQQVLLIHATGFHARCWDAVSRLLPVEWHVFAVDLRGHGRSDKRAPYDWSRFARDLLEIAERFELCDAIGVGHSLGGHCVANICIQNASLFKRLLLIDPVIFSPEFYSEDRQPMFDQVEDHPIARRKGHFDSWQAMYERFADRDPYTLWRDDILEDYCRYGVLPATTAEQGGVVLACPPVVGASVYMTNMDTNIIDRLGEITQPVTLLRARPRDPVSEEMVFSTSPTWPDLVHCFQQGKDVFLPELTHFMPMQAPEMIADFITGERV